MKVYRCDHTLTASHLDLIKACTQSSTRESPWAPYSEETGAEWAPIYIAHVYIGVPYRSRQQSGPILDTQALESVVENRRRPRLAEVRVEIRNRRLLINDRIDYKYSGNITYNMYHKQIGILHRFRLVIERCLLENGILIRSTCSRVFRTKRPFSALRTSER